MFPDCSGAATEDGVNVFAGRDKTSSSELGVELGIKVNLNTPRYIWCLVWKTCIQIVQVLQIRGWLRSVHEKMGVDGDGFGPV